MPDIRFIPVNNHTWTRIQTLYLRHKVVPIAAAPRVLERAACGAVRVVIPPRHVWLGLVTMATPCVRRHRAGVGRGWERG